MEIFLGISILVLLVIIYFAFLKNQNLNTGGVKKYDIQMLFSAMMWNTFWFGLLYYIIGPVKMWEFWFVLAFMFILSLFQYIGKWTAAVFLYILCFCFLIGYAYKDYIWPTKTNFTIQNTITGVEYTETAPYKCEIPYNYRIIAHIGTMLEVTLTDRKGNFIHRDTLYGNSDAWESTFPNHNKGDIFIFKGINP